MGSAGPSPPQDGSKSANIPITAQQAADPIASPESSLRAIMIEKKTSHVVGSWRLDRVASPPRSEATIEP